MQPTLTAQDLMLIVDANKAKLKSATVQGSDTESREWRAHLRGINQAIREGKYTELRRVDWEEIYYSLDSHGDPGKVIEKIGVDGCNMYEHARPTFNAPAQPILNDNYWRFLRCVEALSEAAAELNRADWENVGNNPASANMYPFHQSFDELYSGILEWEHAVRDMVNQHERAKTVNGAGVQS